MTNHATLRLYAIDEEVRSGVYPTARMLATKLEVSLRTIMRDIEFLRDSLSAPLEFDMQNGGWHYTEPTYFLKYTPISKSETFALNLLRPLLSEYANTPLAENLGSLFDKLVEQGVADKPDADKAFCSKYITYIPDVLPSIDSTVFATVIQALGKGHSLQFDYMGLKDDALKPREADPYHVVSHRGSWYVIAYCHDRQAVRLFSFSRMMHVRVTDSEYTIPDDFDVTKYVDVNMGVWMAEHEVFQVKLLFDKSVAVFARERHWGANQTAEVHDDGSVEVCFETTQMTETMRLVMGQCGTCRVLAPAELRDNVQKAAEKIAAEHKS